MQRILTALLSLFMIGCSRPGPDIEPRTDVVQAPETFDDSIGDWKNIHSMNPELAGVLVQQFPDSSFGASVYQGAHPAMILFVMWDGRVNQIGYEPSGKAEENFWWNLNERPRDYSYIWEQLDYSKGSDPEFMRHRDPRAAPRRRS
jgi:hypothetical protein